MNKLMCAILMCGGFLGGFIAGVKYCDDEIQEMEMRSFRSHVPMHDSSMFYTSLKGLKRNGETVTCNHRQYPPRGERNKKAGTLSTVFTVPHKNKRVARPRPGTEHGF